MPARISTTSPTVAQHAVEQLKQYVSKAAYGVQPYIQNCTMEHYHHFLDMMYHYTLTSEEKLRFAASLSPTEELTNFFNYMADEEKGHYRLAQADLKKGFGLEVTTPTPIVITRYDVFWNSIRASKALKFLGAVCVFENVAGYLTKDVLDMIDRLRLTKRQSTWLIVHLEADVDHGAGAYEFTTKYLDSYSEDILEGARVAQEIWVDIFQEAFS